MSILNNLIELTEKTKILWNKYEKNSYTTKVNGIFLKVIREDVDDENYLAYRHSLFVEAPYIKPQIIEDDIRIEYLYDVINRMNNVTGFGVLEETLNKMMEKN